MVSDRAPSMGKRSRIPTGKERTVTRFLTVCLLLAAPAAFAQGASQPSTPSQPATPPAQTAPADQQAAPDPQATPSEQQAAPGQAMPPPVEDRVQREQLKREVLEDVREALDEQREQLREEIRAQIATQQANRVLEEEFQFQEERRRLELFELDGYFRMRPELFYKLDLDRGADPAGFTLFPRPALEGDSKTLADANVRWRLEPTLNVSEDVRLRAQIDVFDNLILGSTPLGAFGRNAYAPISVSNTAQVPPELGFNWRQDAIVVRRAYGEVVTPVGQFLFGRMGSQWGMGVLTHSGNCIESDYGGCDYGDTVDRIMFVTTPIAGHYIVPFLDFVVEGPTSIRSAELFGQPVDLDQRDDARDYGIAIAKRDTDLEIERKLGAGQNILNYGLYFVYRTQNSDAAGFYSQPSPYGGQQQSFGYLARDAQFYIPDLWFKYQTSKLRLELEIAGIFGTIGNIALDPAAVPQDPSVTVLQYGGAATVEYGVLSSLDIGLEVGFASGDKGPGMGNQQGRDVVPQAGLIDAPQWCLTDACTLGRDSRITNFRFNRAYRVDLILWREIFEGVTDAIYVKPGIKYELTEGLDLWGNVIYSRAIYGS
ncbi:MAG TPA: TIGR04551 family protein, partial [Myxococcales bacterium]|nr:TIGR04551 family protein [Myxococcales bacterium]